MLSGGAAVAEKNLIGELDMYREAGIKPNFSDIAKRYGKDRHTVAAYWRAEGGRPRGGRRQAVPPLRDDQDNGPVVPPEGRVHRR